MCIEGWHIGELAVIDKCIFRRMKNKYRLAQKQQIRDRRYMDSIYFPSPNYAYSFVSSIVQATKEKIYSAPVKTLVATFTSRETGV